MKRQFISLIAIFCMAINVNLFAECSDGPYALYVNGSSAASFSDGGTSPDGLPQLEATATLKANDKVEFCNTSCDARWFPQNIEDGGDTNGKGNFNITAGTVAICNVAGTYTFYWKKRPNDDIVYISTTGGSTGGGDNGGGNVGDCQDGPYAVLVNGKTYFDLEYEGPWDMDETFVQYHAYAKFAANDTWTLVNKSCNQPFLVEIEDGGKKGNFNVGADKITCTVAGCYVIYVKMKSGEDKVYIDSATDCTEGNDGKDNNNTNRSHYSSQVPSRCPDVMLQAFYWDSNSDKGYGDTKWATLQKQASEIAAYFDLVWLPPSAKSTGGVGYIPIQYNNQNSAWGSRAELEQLIATLHAGGSKVLADIVVNHAGGQTNWCDMATMDFGTYGKFTPQMSWICNTDEINKDKNSGACFGKAAGGADEGEDFDGGRDWDHNNAQVRAMCQAYVKWMYNVMQYDGWRYDMTKGYHNSHVNDYNKASQAYFSVMEYWDGNVNVIRDRLNDAGYNTLCFDFATKYQAFNGENGVGIAPGNFNLQGKGMLGAGLKKYAVTYVDSHDSFSRDDSEFCGKGNSMKYPDKIKQANAYILCMPGVPCVFYPHWVKFKSDIAPMIIARHETGVHSESDVKDEESEAGGYAITVIGTNGELRLLLGNKAGQTPSGFTKACSGTGWAVWKKVNKAVAPKLIIEPGSQIFKDNTTGVNVTMRTVPTGGTIYYTTDGSDPKTSSTKQKYASSIKITKTTTVKAYAENNGAQTDVQQAVYTYKEPQNTDVNPITLRFNPQGAWASVYLWTWDGHSVAEKWPGLEITEKDADGWYSYTLPKGVKSVKFIWNDGGKGQQTADLQTDEDVCYVWTSGAEELSPNCSASQSDGLEEVELAGEKVQIYPNPVREQLNIITDATVNATYIYNVAGQCQMIERGDNKTLNVSELPAGMYIMQLQTATGNTATQMFIKQ